MATSKTKYEPKGVTTSIKFTSRASVCVTTKNNDKNFYTVEACEERIIPDLEDVDITEERKALWNCVNEEVDMQIEDILKLTKK